MSKVTFRFPSKMIQYGYAETEFDSMGLSNEALGKMYAEATLKFQSAEIDAFEAAQQAAKDLMTQELGAKVIGEQENPEPENEESPTDQAGAPWDRPAAPSVVKPWEGPTPSFNFGS